MYQITLWDWIAEQDDELTACVRHPMCEGGKIRIFALYQHERDARKRARFIRDEYGLSGRTICVNGKTGFVDYRCKNIRTFTFREDSGYRYYSWQDAEKRIGELIGKGQYLSSKDMAKWESLTDRPYPEPCYRYPPEVEEEEQA